MKTKNLNIRLALLYYIVVVLFSGYVEHSNLWNLGTLMIFVMLCFTHRKKLERNKTIIVLTLITIILLLINIVASNGYDALGANIRSLSYSVSVLVSFAIIENECPGIVYYELRRFIFPLNAFLLVNIYIIYKQVNGVPMFIKSEWLVDNPFYKDHCSGLFGKNSTDLVGYFTILISILNINIFKTKNIYKKVFAYIYVLVTSGIVFYLSTLNDGNAFLLLLPATLTLNVFCSNDENARKRILNVLKYICIAGLAIMIVLSIPGIRDYIQIKLHNRITGMFTNAKSTSALGSTERLAIAYYGLKNGWGWFLGKGIGYAKFHAQKLFGFYHFGMSSIGSFINLLGIWFYLIYCTLYGSLLLFIVSKMRRNVFRFRNGIIAWMIMIVLSSYTFLFTEIRTVIMVTLIALVILYNDGAKNSERKTKQKT